MSRNSGGTYSLPAGQPVVTGSTIDATVFNTLTTDLATEMTDSLDRSGKGAMLAPLQLPNGTELLPSLTFAADATLGVFRESATGDLLITQGGEIARFRQAGLNLSVPLTATGQAVTPLAQALGSNWTGTVTQWVDTLSKECKMKGSALTGASANVVVATLPAGSRPSVLISLLVPKSVSGTYSVGAITIDTTGAITIQTGVTAGTTYWFDQVRFLHA